MIRNLAAAVSVAASLAAHAQSYPSGPINLVIPLAAGDATDTAARAITEELSRELKVAIVPVNRPGAAGALGTMTGHLKSGAVRGIVASSKVTEFPDIPTLAELGYSEPLFGIWTAFFAPAGVPPEVTGVLVPALERAISAPGVAARLKPLGIVPEYASPERLVAEMREEHRRVSELAHQAGLVK
jgi:tripartite-type tricarboxylate transporter receptor subunit TctC